MTEKILFFCVLITQTERANRSDISEVATICADYDHVQTKTCFRISLQVSSTITTVVT